MKTKIALFAALVLGPVAFASEEIKATPSSQGEPQRLEKFMVTGSLENDSPDVERLEKFMVTGSLENPPGEVEKLEKFMVTGSLENSPGEPQKLEKFMVTGSMAVEPMKRRYPNKR